MSYTVRLGHSHKTISYVSFCFLIIYDESSCVNSSNPWAIAMLRVLLCRHIMVYGFFTLEGNYASGEL